MLNGNCCQTTQANQPFLRKALLRKAAPGKPDQNRNHLGENHLPEVCSQLITLSLHGFNDYLGDAPIGLASNCKEIDTTVPIDAQDESRA